MGSEEPWRGQRRGLEVTVSHPLHKGFLHFAVYNPLPSTVTVHLGNMPVKWVLSLPFYGCDSERLRHFSMAAQYQSEVFVLRLSGITVRFEDLMNAMTLLGKYT